MEILTDFFSIEYSSDTLSYTCEIYKYLDILKSVIVNYVFVNVYSIGESQYQALQSFYLLPHKIVRLVTPVNSLKHKECKTYGNCIFDIIVLWIITFNPRGFNPEPGRFYLLMHIAYQKRWYLKGA